MQDNINIIIAKAEELSKLLKEHIVTKEYQQSLAIMQQDAHSQELLKKIILLGKEINDKIAAGENVALMSAEHQQLKDEFEQNELVKQHIQKQAAYMHMMQKVLDRIRNPLPE